MPCTALTLGFSAKNFLKFENNLIKEMNYTTLMTTAVTYLSKINDTGKISIKYNSFSQRYYNSTLTLKVNKATGNIESAVFDMTVDVDVRNLEMKYSLITSSMDVSFTCRNVVTLELGSYTN